MEETALLALVRARDFDDAATGALDRHGPDVYGFLVSLLGAESDGDEA